MRITALVLGILGGLGALFGSMIALGGAALSTASTNPDTTAVTGQLAGAGAMGFVLAVVGFVGAGLAMTKPRAAAVCLIVAGVGLVSAIGGFSIFSAPLLIIASLLAFLGRGSKAATTTTVATG
jgi:hypothetical protein